MTIALLATGDEIILGDTLNSNSYQLAHALSSEGLAMGRQLSCTDQENDIVGCLDFLARDHNIIIVTGGLGPTSDDRTRFALSRFTNTPLTDFPDALEHIKFRLRHSNLSITSGNQQQARFPPGAELLPNPNGTAMGCFFAHNNIWYFLLPGPPRECLPMFNDYVLPRLQKTQHDGTQLLKWRLFGVAESQIAQQLDDALRQLDCETGYRLETPYVECKVRCRPDMLAAVRAVVEPVVAPHIISGIDKKASERLRDALSDWKMPITILDDVSGGLLQSLIQTPDNEQWLSFYNNQAGRLLCHISGLREYWSSQPRVGTTSLSIQIKHEGGEINETHELPFRSPLVVHYAAEWSSFRLFQLINQIHDRIA